jgi:hypothetical protein
MFFLHLLAALTVQVTVPAAVHPEPITGRVFVIFAKSPKPEPRIAILSPESNPPFFGMDVDALAPGTPATFDSSAIGSPIRTIADLPPGDYYAEAFANAYEHYTRSDGHSLWAMPQWGPQIFSLEPGALHSAIVKVHVDGSGTQQLQFTLDQTVGENDIANLLGGDGYDNDTPWIKHIRIKSAILSKFWGRPIYLGATVLLPKGYAAHPNARYPVVYNQGHYYDPIPWEFTTDAKTETPEAAAAGKRSGLGTGYEFYEAWNSAHFPRFLMITWQHPCPFFDDSYAVNTANCGPYGDAITKELMPYLETHFRVLREARARIVEGGSTGGWESLALQLFHPDLFGGAYVFDPDPIDFTAFQQIDLYHDESGFGVTTPDGFHTYARPFDRTPRGQVLTTEEQLSLYEEAMGSHGRSEYQLEGWWAIFDPAGTDGYPVPMWNMETGVIDRSVVQYARSQGYDLVAYMKDHWAQLAPQLRGRLKFFVGDMDSYYLNLAVYKAQDFLDTKPDAHATFTYGRPMKGHGWHPMTWAQLLEMIAKQVHTNAPRGESDAQWNY